MKSLLPKWIQAIMSNNKKRREQMQLHDAIINRLGSINTHFSMAAPWHVPETAKLLVHRVNLEALLVRGAYYRTLRPMGVLEHLIYAPELERNNSKFREADRRIKDEMILLDCKVCPVDKVVGL